MDFLRKSSKKELFKNCLKKCFEIFRKISIGLQEAYNTVEFTSSKTVFDAVPTKTFLKWSSNQDFDDKIQSQCLEPDSG